MRFSGLAFGFSSLSSTFEISFLIRVLAPQGGAYSKKMELTSRGVAKTQCRRELHGAP